MSKRLTLKSLLLGASAMCALGLSASNYAIDNIHFLIPASPGGGWDITARGTGKALTQSGIVNNTSYEHMSGGGGGKAIRYLIDNADSNPNTLLISSTPIVIRSLTNVFPQNFRDLTMVAGTIGDYAVFAVPNNSPYKTFNDVITSFKKNPRKIAVAGGSVPGGMDHLVAAMVFEAAGEDPKKVRYIAYDAGGKAIESLVRGETSILSTSLSESIELTREGKVRILAIMAPERIATIPDVPTLKEQGIDAEFVNWRGFFAAPGISQAKRQEYTAALSKMYDTPEWEAVRAHNGWVNIFHPGDEFTAYLEKQEKVIGDLMRELGFL